MGYNAAPGKSPMLITVPHVMAYHVAVAAESRGLSKSAYVNSVLAEALCVEPAVREAMSEAMRAYDRKKVK